LATWHTQGEAAARKALEKQTNSSLQKDWQQSIVDYLLRRTSETAFLAMADNRCKKTEANFYIGYRYLLEQDTENAIKYFQQTVDFQFWGHYATTLALARMNNSNSNTTNAVSAEPSSRRVEPTDATQTGGN
jgi:lipoprotein NlpI